jgi:hypothetical protein
MTKLEQEEAEHHDHGGRLHDSPKRELGAVRHSESLTA